MRLEWVEQRRGDFNPEWVWGPIALGVLLAARFFPFHRLPSMCTFYVVTGHPCPSCGGTRAFVALAHGHWIEGLRFNPLATVLFFVCVAYVFYAAVVLIGRRRRLRLQLERRAERIAAVAIPVALILVNWAYLVLWSPL